ncbi:tyrosine-type recombinase/integrase [Georgenia faecalis]|uniref:tyrosine-type recombinase/integrase n=1 Tax=Georgenia faecalis TaxID=2483799 RepID=UPI000FD83A34|nr:site-specific integrase [Georgenia faecalis]
MAHVADRWTVPSPSGRRIKGPRHGQGMRWQAVWHEPDGTRRRQSFTTKDAAQAHLDHVAVTQRAGTYVSPDRGRITVAEMAARWRTEQVHQRATSLDVVDRRLRNTLLPTLGHVRLADLDRGAVQAAVTQWAGDLAPTTVRVTYVYLAQILTLAIDERRIAASPCRRINLPPVDREPVIPLTVAQVQAVTDALWRPYRPMAVLAAATGMRSGELRGLTWDRVEVRADGTGRVRVDRQLVGGTAQEPLWGPPKTGTSVRVIGIGPATVAALGEPGEGLLVRGARGGAVNRQRASEAWRHAAQAVGLPVGSGWHELRHFHASLLIAGGASPVAVAHRLGHKDPVETLRTYAHLWPDDDDRMRDAADGLISLGS